MTRLSHLKLKIHRQRTGSNKWVCLFPPKEKRVQEKHYHWNATIGCAFVHLYKWFVLSNKAVILTDLQECFLALMNSANEVFLLWCCTVEQMLAVASFVPDAFRELQKWSETQVWQTHSCASTSAAAGWTQRARGCTAEQTPTNMLLWCHLAQGRKQCSLSPLIELLYLKPQLQRTLVSKANHVVSFRHVFQWKMKNVCWVWHWEAAFWFISEENSSFASLWCMDTNMAWYSNELHVQKPETTVLMH